MNWRNFFSEPYDYYNEVEVEVEVEVKEEEEGFGQTKSVGLTSFSNTTRFQLAATVVTRKLVT